MNGREGRALRRPTIAWDLTQSYASDMVNAAKWCWSPAILPLSESKAVGWHLGAASNSARMTILINSLLRMAFDFDIERWLAALV